MGWLEWVISAGRSSSSGNGVGHGKHAEAADVAGGKRGAQQQQQQQQQDRQLSVCMLERLRLVVPLMVHLLGSDWAAAVLLPALATWTAAAAAGSSPAGMRGPASSAAGAAGEAADWLPVLTITQDVAGLVSAAVARLVEGSEASSDDAGQVLGSGGAEHMLHAVLSALCAVHGLASVGQLLSSFLWQLPRGTATASIKVQCEAAHTLVRLHGLLGVAAAGQLGQLVAHVLQGRHGQQDAVAVRSKVQLVCRGLQAQQLQWQGALGYWCRWFGPGRVNRQLRRALQALGAIATLPGPDADASHGTSA
jgi:hypothetical protein